MKSKKIIIVLVIAIIAGLLFTGCESQNSTITKAVTAEGAIFGGKSDDKIKLNLKFDPAWITSSDNTKYNKELAEFSTLLSTDMYFRDKDLEKGTQNRILFDENPEEYSETQFMEKMGYEDVQKIESFKISDATEDTDDSVTMVIGYKNVNGYDSFMVGIRGCFSTQEWNSALDAGSSTESYKNDTGEHPDWLNLNNLKGYDVAANRAKKIIDEYIQTHDDSGRENAILITGHSRGGSIANILGAAYEKSGSVKAFTYTFAATTVTEDADAKSYKTIFNICNKGDFFSSLILSKNITRQRYGTDLVLDDKDREAALKKVVELKGRDDYEEISSDVFEQYKEKFIARFPDRDSIYVHTTITRTFDSEEEAVARHDEIEEMIGSEYGLDIEKFYKLGDVTKNKDGKYEFSVEYSGGAVLRCFAKILAYGAQAHEMVKVVLEGDEGSGLADIIAANSQQIVAAHRIINYYVASGFVGQ